MPVRNGHRSGLAEDHRSHPLVSPRVYHRSLPDRERGLLDTPALCIAEGETEGYTPKLLNKMHAWTMAPMKHPSLSLTILLSELCSDSSAHLCKTIRH